MSKVFVTSDTHFGHANIIHYTGRPFESAYHMDGELIRRWNDRVGKDDAVYFLGDFAMGRGVDADYITNVLSQLNGDIKIILGNHDMPSRWTIGLAEILRHRFPEIEVLGSESFALKHDGKTFLMYHYPIVDWDDRFNGTIHLHGHSHGRVTDQIPDEVTKPADTWSTPNGRWLTSVVEPAEGRYDVGVDSYGGPVELTGDCRYLNNPKGWE